MAGAAYIRLALDGCSLPLGHLCFPLLLASRVSALEFSGRIYGLETRVACSNLTSQGLCRESCQIIHETPRFERTRVSGKVSSYVYIDKSSHINKPTGVSNVYFHSSKLHGTQASRLDCLLDLVLDGDNAAPPALLSFTFRVLFLDDPVQP